MLEGLSEKLRRVLKGVRGQGTLTESNIKEALREVRMALLEADVNFAVVKEFTAAVKEKAMGGEVLASLTPGQQFTKIVKDELTRFLGGAAAELELKGRPAVIMMVGLQGSGKTTTTAKLARFLKGRGRSPLVVAADLVRPAAVLQLQRLSREVGADFFDIGDMKDPASICAEALRVAAIKGYDTMLVDTAGRLHIDDGLMEELRTLKSILKPCETLFVADAMTGQDAVNTAGGFHEAIDITGVVLTKLDSDARGGAALSMRMTTGRPVKFVGLSEKMDGLEVFHPDRLAGRILGMGDVLTLVEKAQAVVDREQARSLERKIRRDAFTLQDFKDQLRQIRKMGSLDSILSMIPGFDALKKSKGLTVDEREFKVVEAIIDSMTVKERLNPACLNARRKQRIAAGSGTTVQDVNRLIKQYDQMRKLMKRFSKKGARGLKGLFQGLGR
ncbi:MAG TPA: signal recognition particle protein [Deltaproteobacteria bacterium]|nr:signal recognition particle protein [Deltaproteobacteria bacterium]